MMNTPFGTLPNGAQATLYTIKNQIITANVTDFGATLVNLWVPDRNGNMADVVLGYDSAAVYAADNSCMGATVGRNANRIAGASFMLGDRHVRLVANDGQNSLHSLPDGYSHRLWKVTEYKEDSITFLLESPHLDQGFPGNAIIRVTYAIEAPTALSITYQAVSDMDTVFNLTNHSFFNLAGHENTDKACKQELILPARVFVPSDGHSIPLGEERPVEGTPMDFRTGKVIEADIDSEYECLLLQGGYDHTFEVFTEPGAVLRDPDSGRTMAVTTDCPGIHFYSGNYLNGAPGKGGVIYPRRSGMCLEAHYYPDAVHNPQWKQPVIKAGVPCIHRTKFQFSSY